MYELAIFAAGFASGVAGYGGIKFAIDRFKRIDWDTTDSK
jgi:hypothetical protein